MLKVCRALMSNRSQARCEIEKAYLYLHRIFITYLPLDFVSMADRERFDVICVFLPTLYGSIYSVEQTSSLIYCSNFNAA